MLNCWVSPRPAKVAFKCVLDLRKWPFKCVFRSCVIIELTFFPLFHWSFFVVEIGNQLMASADEKKNGSF